METLIAYFFLALFQNLFRSPQYLIEKAWQLSNFVINLFLLIFVVLNLMLQKSAFNITLIRFLIFSEHLLCTNLLLIEVPILRV
jgi:hypothetical protein